MYMTFDVEYELTKEVIYNDDIEPISEYTFVISGAWLNILWHESLRGLFTDYESLDDFLDIYDPEYEGSIIYEYSKKAGEIKEEGWKEVELFDYND